LKRVSTREVTWGGREENKGWREGGREYDIAESFFRRREERFELEGTFERGWGWTAEAMKGMFIL